MNNYGLLIRNKHPASRQARLCRRDQARSGQAPDIHLKVEMSDDATLSHCLTVSLSLSAAPENFNLPIIGPNFDYLIRENARSLSRNLESKLNCDNFQTVKLSSFSAIRNKRERGPQRMFSRNCEHVLLYLLLNSMCWRFAKY